MTEPIPLPVQKLRSHGEAERRRRLELGPAGPWQAKATVDAIKTNHGRHTTVPQDWLFEVAVEWVGPPAIGMPWSAEPVHSRDAYVVPNEEDARVLARKAFEAFSKGGDEPPDLRELAGVKDR